jgi:hypothetical protein
MTSTAKTDAYQDGEKIGNEIVNSGRCRVSADVTSFKNNLNPYDPNEKPALFQDWREGFSDGYEAGRCTGDDSQD